MCRCQGCTLDTQAPGGNGAATLPDHRIGSIVFTDFERLTIAKRYQTLNTLAINVNESSYLESRDRFGVINWSIKEAEYDHPITLRSGLSSTTCAMTRFTAVRCAVTVG